MMKQTSQVAIVSFFLLLIISLTSNALRPSHQLGESPEAKPAEINLQQEDTFSSLIGLEECGDKDESCQMRRMVAEAHLDYIYTQKHQP